MSTRAVPARMSVLLHAAFVAALFAGLTGATGCVAQTGDPEEDLPGAPGVSAVAGAGSVETSEEDDADAPANLDAPADTVDRAEIAEAEATPAPKSPLATASAKDRSLHPENDPRIGGMFLDPPPTPWEPGH